MFRRGGATNSDCWRLIVMNILVIDDDTSLRRTIRMSLEVLGHQAVEARDGEGVFKSGARAQLDVAG